MADPVFCESLINHPRPFLLDKSDKYTRFAQYIILRDTPSLKHYIIPSVQSTVEDSAGLLANIQREIGEEDDYSEFLPAIVIHRALTDDKFRILLIRSPNAILEEIGFPCSYPMRVIENAEGVYHIPLRVNPVINTDLKPTFENLRSTMAKVNSTRCCASGTCDCNDIHI